MEKDIEKFKELLDLYIIYYKFKDEKYRKTMRYKFEKVKEELIKMYND